MNGSSATPVRDLTEKQLLDELARIREREHQIITELNRRAPRGAVA